MAHWIAGAAATIVKPFSLDELSHAGGSSVTWRQSASARTTTTCSPGSARWTARH